MEVDRTYGPERTGPRSPPRQATVCLVGLIAGVIARFLVPGPDPMGWVGTLILGIVGSFVGGTLAALVVGGTVTLSTAGIIGSIIGAIIVLLIWRAMGGRRGAVA